MAAKKKDGDKKKSPLPKVIVALVVAGAGYKFMLAPKPKPAEPVAAGAEAHAEIPEGGVIALPDLTLNLADNDPRYLRVGIALILEAGTSMEHMKEELPIASDVAVDVLSSKTFKELHAPGAKQAIKDELSQKVREAFHDEKVARVIFTSFVMQ